MNAVMILLALADLAAPNGWTNLAPRIDEAFDHLRWRQATDENESDVYLFEVAFQAMLEPNLYDRASVLATAIQDLSKIGALREHAENAA